jgi:hypothetical protein
MSMSPGGACSTFKLIEFALKADSVHVFRHIWFKTTKAASLVPPMTLPMKCGHHQQQKLTSIAVVCACAWVKSLQFYLQESGGRLKYEIICACLRCGSQPRTPCQTLWWCRHRRVCPCVCARLCCGSQPRTPCQTLWWCRHRRVCPCLCARLCCGSQPRTPCQMLNIFWFVCLLEQ